MKTWNGRSGLWPAWARATAIPVLWLCIGLGSAVLPGRLAAQDTPQPQSPVAPSPMVPPGGPGPAPGGPRPSGIPPEIGGDRPRVVPGPLREGRILPDSGVEVSAGALSMSVESHQLQFKQGPKDLLSDGAIVAADLVLGDLRFSYSKILLRRPLEPGAQYVGVPVDFLGVDVDQFWTYYGFRPVHPLYVGAGLAYEYRLTRLSFAGSTVVTVTENLGAAGLIVDWAISPPIMLQLRVMQEEGGHLVTISGTTYQLGYIVPF